MILYKVHVYYVDGDSRDIWFTTKKAAKTFYKKVEKEYDENIRRAHAPSKVRIARGKAGLEKWLNLRGSL